MSALPQGETPFEEIRQRAERQAARDRLRAAQPAEETVRAGDAVDPWEHDERRYSIGLSNIDLSMGLRRPGDMTVVGALTGVGKTSLLEQAAVANASAGRTVFIATLEMTEPELEAKFVGRRMMTDLLGFERARRARSQEYLAALEWLRDLNIHFWRPPVGRDADPQAMFRVAARAQADLVMIDHAKLLGGWAPGTPGAKVAQYLSAHAKHTGMHLVVLAQLKSDMLLHKGRRPTLADMEDTKVLAQESTATVLIHRPFNGQPKRDVIAEFIVAKNRRGGATFCGHAHWHGPTQSFGSMSHEDEATAECCKKKTPAVAQPKTTPRGRAQRAAYAAPTPMFEAAGPDEPEYDPNELNFNSEEY